MAITNRERVGRALELLSKGLAPFVEREIRSRVEAGFKPSGLHSFLTDPLTKDKPILEWDSQALLKVMWDTWNDVFRDTLSHNERSWVSELRSIRNSWAHEGSFSSDDAHRALDTASRLLTAISAPEAEELNKMKQELLRITFDEQARHQRRKSESAAITTSVDSTLRPWREIITPHPDVANGKYQQAEFAADLWQVHLGEGSSEYRNPTEFFRRTFITANLKQLLINAIQRLGSDNSGDPVVQLQTNFGGGKTHSMLAVYHLFSGVSTNELPGIEDIIAEGEVEELPTVKRVVLVGNKISAGSPTIKEDGTKVNTLWGELAWQLGGRKAYEVVRQDDENSTNPGDKLRKLFQEYGPCLILLDEWVAYARQLHNEATLAGGSFETQFSFAQALTESAKLADNCLLVVSLPASDVAGTHSTPEDIEVGGTQGRIALNRLQNVVGRVASTWRPATAEESFEIVRRRLFQPISDPDLFKHRDVTARSFVRFYSDERQEFPNETREAEYEQRIKAAFPIHPEVFTRLYRDWSTLARFQRTRGVLRLMASVIHSLWQSGDRNPLIMPATIPIEDPQIQSELTRYLDDNWAPIIERDVDGPDSLPVEIDNSVPNLGRISATRRVARTIYLGSAPITDIGSRGLEERRIKLGSVMPGESPTIFGDALRRLTARATYLYQDGPRYWYDTQATVTKLAEDRAEQFKHNVDLINEELLRRLNSNISAKGDFFGVHALPTTSSDVPDTLESRLVVLGRDQAHTRNTESPALSAAKHILDTRGSSPRTFKNTLIFLAPDEIRLGDLDEALASYLAWQSILEEHETLDLSRSQFRQAEGAKEAANSTIEARLPESFRWIVLPSQESPSSPVTFEVIQLQSQGALAERVSRRLRQDELLITKFAANALLLEIEQIPLWRGDSVRIGQLVDDFASYPYLPRLASPQVLYNAIQTGLDMLSWALDSFAYAESYDEETKRYIGLQAGKAIDVSESDPGLLVKPSVAEEQLASERQDSEAKPSNGLPEQVDDPADSKTAQTSGPTQQKVQPKRFFGSVSLTSDRVGRDAGQIAEEIISHLTGLIGSNVSVTLEIEATVEGGIPDNILRVISENADVLNFTSKEFEEE